VYAGIPFQGCLRVQVADGSDRISEEAGSRREKGANRRRQRAVDAGARPPEQAGYADGQLSTEHRRREGTGGVEQNEISLRIQVKVQADVDCRRDPADLDFPCRRHSARPRYRGVIIHLRH
jgi:hypothetical protein